MEHDALIRQHGQLVQLAQGLASASEELATSLGEDETAISPPTTYELLAHLMDTIMTLRNMTDVLRSRMVASLYRTESGLSLVDLVTGKTRDREEAVLAADADILRSATSLELVERCLSRARNALAPQVCQHANCSPAMKFSRTP